MTDDYLIAIADGLVFTLGKAWQRLSAADPAISRDRVRAALAELADHGANPSFGDGELPVVPDAAASAVAVLRDQLDRVRAVAPRVLAGGADTSARILCTDPWPRIYTTAVLDVPATSPVHVIHASDLAGRLDQWARVGQLTAFRELRVLVMFGAPLGRAPWPFELDAFPELRVLNVSGSRMRTLPPSLARATSLEALELGDNPLDAASLSVLASLPALRYVGLRGTGLGRAQVPVDCELALDEEVE